MNTNTTLLQMGRNAIGRLLSAPPSGSLLRKAATLLCAALAVNTAADAQSTTFNYTGSAQTYSVTSTGTLLIDMAGAKGGNKYSSGSTYGPRTQAGGNGGRVVCSLAVTAGQVLNIYVGGQGQTPTSYIPSASGGFNGGGNSGSCPSFSCGGENHTTGGGGGATDIRIGGTALANRVIVAGGGGGAGFNGGSINSDIGGPGGGLTGGQGYNSSIPQGNGGTQTAGGPGTVTGALGSGANGSGMTLAGGGGGGYYGGGTGPGSGGGGGSSFTHATLATGVTHTQGYQAGNGYVIVTPVVTAKEAVNFDGSNDIIIAPNNATTHLTSGTVEAWFKTSNAGSSWRGIVAKQYAYGFFLYDNELVAYDWNTGSNIPTGIYPNDGNWHHVAMTFQSGVTNGSSIYYDGVFVRNFTMAVVNQSVALAVAGGTDAATGYQSFTGSIDEVRVWNTIRTGTEISTNKDCDIAASSALKLYYRFNDGTAGGTNTSLSKVADYSGNGNCGTIYNMALSGSSSNFVTGAIGTCNSIAVSAANTGSATVCVGNTTSLSNSVSGGTWSSSNGAVATVGSTTGVVTGVAGGTAVISYITCNATNTTIVTVNARPTVGAGSGVAICNGSSTTLSATGASTYTWAPGTGLSATTGSSVTAGPTSLTTYTVTGTDALGCTNTATKVVSVNALPSVSAGSGVAICIGSSTTLTATGASTYTWAPGTGLSATTGTSVTANPTTLTTYTVTGTDANGCVNTATKVVTVNPLPTNTIASFTPSPTIAGLPVSFTVSNVSLSSYSWNFGDATSSTTMNPTKAYATSGTFVPTLTVTNSNGCSSSDTAVVTVLPVPPITGYMPPLCSADAPDTLSITVPGGTWSSSNTAVATVGSSTGILTYVNVGTAVITYHFGSGLFTTISVTAGNSPNPIFGPSTTCMGSNTGLNVTPYGSAGVWTSSTTSVATIGTGNGICSAVSLGTTTITWTNPWGCYVTRTQTVVASPAAITGPSFLCAGDTATYLNDTVGGTWSSTNSGVVSVDASTGLATGVASGTATLSYTIAYGCASTKLVNGGALPATITGGLLLCPGGTSALSCATPGGSWTTSDGSVATVSGGTVTAVGTGTANITYTIPSGCRRVATVTVNAAPGANTGTAELCVGGSTTLSNATGGGTWSSGSTSVATVGSSTGVVTGVSTGNANITYTVSGAGCYSATTVTVNGATGAITGTLNACVGDTSVLSHGTTGGTWSSSNTSIATVDATSGAVVGVAAGTATITYFITSSCYVTTSFTVKALPTAISGTQSVCVGSTTALASGPTGGTWTSASTTIAVVNASTGLVNGVSAGESTISYSISNGCRRTVVVTVNEVPASITGPSGTCVGASATLASTTGGGTWSSSNTTVATIDGTTGVVSGLVTGTTRISYTLSTGCRATRIMSVVAAPAAISGTATLCAGSVTTLSSTTGGGTWSSSDITIATTGTATGTSTVVSGVSTGNATISYTVGGCSTTREVTVNASPGTISGPSELCIGNSTTYSIGGTGGTWVSSTSRVTIGSATGVATAITAGTNTITYRQSATCYSTLPVTVTATPAAITGTARVCVGYTTVLGHPVSGGSWSGGSTAVSVSDSAGFGVVSGSTAGTGTITYTLPSGCYRTVVVTVNNNPATPSGGTSPICVGTTTNLTATPAGGTWLSSTTAVGTVGNTTGVVMGVSAGTTTITYRINATGCFSTKEVSVNPLPGMIAGSGTVCVGATTTLSDTTGGGGIWTMTPSTVATIGGSTGTVTGVAAGAATVTYTLSTGCRRTRSMTVLASPSAITGNLTLCVGNITTLGSSPTGLTWSSSDVSVASTATGGIVTGVGTGEATISYTNASGCSRTAVVTVNAALPANTSSTGAMSVCQGATITLSNTVSGGTWSSASSAIASVGSGTGIVTGATVGSTNITYALGTGCRSISTVAVNAAAPAISGTSSVCEGSSVTFTSTGSGTWESGNSSIATVGGGTGVAIPGGPTTIVTGVSAGSTVITYTMPSGCYSTKAILVKTTPVISAPSIMTVGDTLTALSSVSGGTWSSSAAAVAGVISTSGFITAMSAGSVTISFTASSTGCVGSWEIYVMNASESKPGITNAPASMFSIYPNPTVGTLTINTEVDGRLVVQTIDGRTAGSYELTAGSNTIQLSSDLAAGVYMCQFMGTDGSTQQVRMVLQR